ncbi:MAG TPA: hypothetical protein VKV32_10070 [Stellaceae bacterium]|nr:hypothetical protein [Stellaceae bacterium]
MSTTTPLSTGNSLINTLYTMAQDSAALTQNTQLAEISQDLQNQLNRQLAAIQNPVDQVSVNYSQQQINSLQAQQSAVSKAETTFGTNGTILADMTSQLNTMAQAVSNSDGTGFDNALTALNTDLSDLGVAAYNPLFQNDGIGLLKMNGFSIQSSASYNLSTPAGQAAATADVTTAQNLIENILKINGSNQTIASSQASALDGQINALQTMLSQEQDNATAETTKEAQQLQVNEQNELHLIELNMGNTGETSSMLNSILNPPTQVTSVFGALSNAVGETAKTAETQLGQTPAVLSLFA